MKTLLLLLLSAFLTNALLAQKAEKIYGKNRVLKTNDYFLEQMGLWEKEVHKNKKNADAWYNYYRASRNAYIVGEEEESRQSKKKSRFERLQEIVDGMEKAVPKSFEFHYVKWLNGYNDLKLFPYLQKAHELQPERTEPLMDLVLYYEITGDYAQRNKFAKQYYDSGEYSPGLLNYSYNLLSGLENNAILLTEGDKDTEATLLLQGGRQLRTDVRLVNVNLLFIKEYRDRVYRELGVPETAFDPMSSNENYGKHRETLIAHLASNSQNRPVCAAVSVGRDYTEGSKDKLYLTGLARQYSAEPIDHLAILKRNLEQVYALDYLTLSFPGDLSQGNVNQFNGNYIDSLIVLARHYRSSGELSKAGFYLGLAEQVALTAGMSDDFQFLLNKK